MPAEHSTNTVDAADVAAVRRFSRLYTREIGALDREHLATPFALGEARVLYELAHWAETHENAPTASALVQTLALDAGYLSRMLHDFIDRGIVARTRSTDDARQQLLRLTAKGRRLFDKLEARTIDTVGALLATVTPTARREMVQAMQTIERALGTRDTPGAPSYRLREPGPGDLGWVTSRHGALYAEEYQWDSSFEVLVARVAADFFEQHDRSCERGWIAERDTTSGVERLGSVFLVKHPERPGVAKLRLLLVEPAARGLGLGKRLVQECTAFARARGYSTITLWTNSVLVAARGIYASQGYQMVETHPYHMFGHDLVSETWELAL
jgi:DNA-binding MarR family transcriptional regulator/GNAT superfamily N-acetyltransferase